MDRRPGKREVAVLLRRGHNFLRMEEDAMLCFLDLDELAGEASGAFGRNEVVEALALRGAGRVMGGNDVVELDGVEALVFETNSGPGEYCVYGAGEKSPECRLDTAGTICVVRYDDLVALRHRGAAEMAQKYWVPEGSLAVVNGSGDFAVFDRDANEICHMPTSARPRRRRPEHYRPFPPQGRPDRPAHEREM